MGCRRGQLLGPVLFLIYVNDLDQGVSSKLGKFADDSKLCKSVECQTAVDMLRNDLVLLEEWSNLWQMKFNLEKCSVIHLGKNNEQNQYCLGNVKLKCSAKERDLGVVVDKTMKFSEQINSAVGKANATLGMIKRNITCKSKNIVTKMVQSPYQTKTRILCAGMEAIFTKGYLENGKGAAQGN